MPLPAQPAPPQQPPVVHQPVQVVEKPVFVEKPVYRDNPNPVSTSAADLMAESNSSNDSRSNSDSSSVNSASQTNVNVNNSSNRVSVDGIHIPSTTINLSGYYNNNGYNDDFGAIVTVSASLDGKKRANSMLDKRIRLTQLQYERELASTCASINSDGFILNSNSGLLSELSQCNNIIARKSPVVVQQQQQQVVVQQDPMIAQLRAENAELRQQLALILQKLDSNTTVKDGGF